uniref:Uncharacterized protein n=1 Tax=Panagrolaimus sp. JU765 TaxID=591449 RepID=A0AC34QN97_9BILA
MLVTAKYLEKLHIENVMMSKSFLLDFVKKCQNLEELTIKNCIIDETIDVGMDLLVLIPKCKTLCLEGTPEFTTNVFSALDLKVHTLEHGNFSKLTIDPFFPVKNLKVIDDLKNSCQTPIELVCFYDTASSPINSRSDDQFIIKTLTLFLYYFYFPICNSFSSFHSIVADDSENTSFFSGYSWSVVIMWILHFIFQRRFIKFFRRKPSLFRYLYRQTKFQQEFREKFPLAIGCIHTLCMAFLIGTRWLEFPKIVSNLNFVLIFAIHFVMIEFVLLLFNFVLFLYQKFMSKD